MVWWQDCIENQPKIYTSFYNSVSETPLFTLYTSGSTGKPKGILHTTGGYLTYLATTFRYIFGIDLNADNSLGNRVVFGCMADIGWITGHSYVVYGPLISGVATVLFESLPTYPTANRYWEVIEKHKLTHLYTAPTVLRALQAITDVDEVHSTLSGKRSTPYKFDLSSLRILGTVGEPISPVTWQWYFKTVGRSQCQVLDTFWQTETGGITISCLSGLNVSENTSTFFTETDSVPMQPGSASVPFFGIEPVLLNPDTTEPLSLELDSVSGVLAFKKPWPGITRGVLHNPARYRQAYFGTYPGFYFTGDGAQFKNGLFYLTGRVDDVLNVSGHRLSTAEIEAAMAKHENVAEAAVLGQDDSLTGQAICVFVVFKLSVSNEASLEDISAIDFIVRLNSNAALKRQLIDTVRRIIGPIASPKRILFVRDLPKTRSGKIMRRILRKLLEYSSSVENRLLGPVSELKNELGDLSTIQSPQIVDEIYSVILNNP